MKRDGKTATGSAAHPKTNEYPVVKMLPKNIKQI